VRGEEDGAFDLRNGSLNRMYWVIELCGGMAPRDFLNKLLIIPPCGRSGIASVDSRESRGATSSRQRRSA